MVQIEWAGPSAEVVVERSAGSDWAAEGSADPGKVLLEEAGDGAWSARWQLTYDTPSGTYRIRLAGEGFDVTSNEFTVRKCSCVIPGPVKAKFRRGRFHVSVTGEYAPAPLYGFQELPLRVTTGRARVRVFRDGRRVGKVSLRYKRGKFRGKWRGRKGPRNSVVFQLVSLKDQWGNR